MGTSTIGLITYEFASHFHTPLIQTLQKRLYKHGYRLLSILGTPCEVARARVAFAHIDGWLVINSTTGVEALHQSGKPLLLIGGLSDGLPCVICDNHTGTAAALTHLIATGRSRIAFVTYSVNPDFRERYSAYCATLTQYGIALDPTLVLDTHSYQVHDTYQTVRRAITSGIRFDAAFCANDWLAFGTMQAIQEAGWRIPEDVAVIGFDDTAEAQLATPALTSVRQKTTELGNIAVDLLLDQIERGIVPLHHTIVPTALIIRQSSMVASCNVPDPHPALGHPAANWRAQLAHDLAQQVIFPIPLTPDTPAEQVWPGVEALVAALATIVDREDGPQEAPRAVWEHIHNLTSNGETLAQIIELLRSAGVQQINGADSNAMDRLTRWLLACQAEAMNQQVKTTNNHAERDRRLFISESALLSQLGRADSSPRLLDWMAQSASDWAVLGLWHEGEASTDSRVLEINSTYVRERGASADHMRMAPEYFPPLEELPATIRDSPEHLIKLAPLESNGRQWGYLAYAERPVGTFLDMVHQRSIYLTTALEREELIASLHERQLTLQAAYERERELVDTIRERQLTLQAAYERERELADTIRELGCPVIPLLKGVLLVPLVGVIDAVRAAQFVERVLEEVVRMQAEQVLLDITAVPLVDTQVAGALIQIARAVGLLGAKVTLVGVRPEIAQSIVGLGVDLGRFKTSPVLAAALPDLIKRGVDQTEVGFQRTPQRYPQNQHRSLNAHND